MQNENKLGVMPISKLIWNMSLPIIASMLVQALYNIVDSVFVSRVSEQALTAVSLAFPAQNLMIGLATGTAVGVNALMGRALGAQMRERADRVANNGVFLAVVGFLISAVLGLTCADLFFRSQTQVENIIQMGSEYLRIVTIGSLGMFCQIMYERLLQGTGRSLLSMYTQGLGAIVNIVLDPVFIFGLGMGTGGAGTATALSQSISFCILLSMFLRGKTVSRFRITQVTRSARDFGQIFFNGAPSFGRQGLNSIGSMLLNVAARNYGDAAVAGMSIVSRIFQFVLSVAIGVGQGLQPVAAFNYGARRFARVRKAAIFTISTAFVFMAVLNSLCWFNAEPLILLFRDDPEVTAVALPALRYQCVAMFLQPVIIVTNMMFQSIGKSGRATFLACCRQGVCFIPLILTLPRIWGLSGIELCQPIADGLTFCISVPFLLPFLKELKEQGDEE